MRRLFVPYPIRKVYFVRLNDGEELAGATLETLVSLVREGRIDIDTPILHQKSRKAFFPDQHPRLKRELPPLVRSGILLKGNAAEFFLSTERGQLLIAIASMTVALLALSFSIRTH